jgi:glycosyltransferase involved in cell wall biosynthesis
MAPELFVGITTWNSATFLRAALGGIRNTTDAKRTRVVVLDNQSTDDTVAVAKSFGAEVVVRASSQVAALMDLFNFSRSEFTLLMHADVVLLNERWLEVCRARMTGNVALVSPQDIGCGPYTRPWGAGKPESSFLLFRTRLARKIRHWQGWRRRLGLRLPYRGIDLSGDHITWNLPQKLEEQGLTWTPMQVLTSRRMPEPIYTPRFDAPMWKQELAAYRYGLGNFYALDGVVTHYHNWYERALEQVADGSDRTLKPESGGLPVAFLQTYSRNFLGDLARGEVDIPNAEDAR